MKQTPLTEKHTALNAKMTDFGGWNMPLQYDGILKEYAYCRDGAAMFDTGHMGELLFKGNLESSGINEATTVDVLKLPVGKCKYGFILNEKGGIEDDIIVYKMAEDELMIVVNAGTTGNDYALIENRLKEGGTLDNISDVTAKLDIQGPLAKEKLAPLFGDALEGLPFFGFVQTLLYDKPCILSRTGYTGELGYEVYCDAQSVQTLWDALLEAGVKPAGLGARDVLRLEMGYSLYGSDLDTTTTPVEANLHFFIGFEREFVGKEVLVEQKENGASRYLQPFKSASRRSPRHGQKIMQDGQEIGEVTSGVFSPKLGYGIGLGYMSQKLEEGTALVLDDGRSQIEVSVCGLPFYTGGSLKQG